MGCNSSIPKIVDPLIFKEECSHDNYMEEIVVLPNGSRRNVMQWIPKSKQIKAIVLIAHGLHEHALIFDKIAHVFTMMEFACFGIDYIGHGQSEGTKGLVTDHRILTSDFVSFAQFVRSTNEYSKLPTFIFGHSVGTLVAILALNQIPNITSVVFASAAIFPGYAAASPFGVRRLYPLSKTSLARSFTYFTSSLDPKGSSAPILITEVTTDSENMEKILTDGRYYLGQIMNKTAYEILKMRDEAKKEIPNIKTPFLAVHGKLDQIVLVRGSQYLHDMSGTDKRKKSLVVIENCKHHPVIETQEISTDFNLQAANYFDSFLMAKLQMRDISINVST